MYSELLHIQYGRLEVTDLFSFIIIIVIVVVVQKELQLNHKEREEKNKVVDSSCHFFNTLSILINELRHIEEKFKAYANK